ncbi:hypothetical protein C5167_016256 [Papaver somniferum]|uniref:ATP-dependent RNA helicase DEAH11, chloroplastic-like n=1 Tax=Papaver somniferum TaxID=3469 RepID=UPI000E6FC0A6|nr:ATP-dependent RNA helicase DEAH11, chloroplastic-like [Papaver somniferum]RZC88456.1 hypothetical protein C5167_016256 [Papaver somniferum]
MSRVVVSGGCRSGRDFHGGFRSVKRITHQDRGNYSNRFDSGKPNYTVELHSDTKRLKTKEFDVIMKECRVGVSSYDSGYDTFPEGKIPIKLYFRQWNDALDTIIRFWSKRLEGVHVLNSIFPILIPNLFVCSEKDEMMDKMKGLFVKYVKEKLLESEIMRKLGKEIKVITEDIAKIQDVLRRLVRLQEFNEHIAKKDMLVAKRELIKKRLDGFREAMNCILGHLQDLHVEGNGYSSEIDVLKLNKDDFNWSQIHYVLMRECRRLEESLPIYTSRRKILEKIHLQQVIVLIGETGSGKSTQLVQYLADSGLVGDGSIICTQPRKIAAVSLAQRVEEESEGCYDNNSISCCQFYSSAQKFNSKVIFMTDHCLLQHYMNDEKLASVSCIIVDEAHERSLNTDLLLALIKGLLLKRTELKLIIMSATADADKLSAYFFGCDTVHLVGRNYPVDIEYVPGEFSEAFSTLRPYSGNCPLYVSEVVKIATRIHKTEEEGAILAFLTSGNEVELACENFGIPDAISLPLHGKLSSEEQSRVFQNYSKRKIIFATNIAETSLTIPSVKYVVDSGMVKESRFEASSGMNVLKVCRVSRSAANQRAGRAGRTSPGKCYRLYSEFDFQSMPSHQEPEIQRVHLGVAVLRILSVGITDVQEFDFVDAPSPKAIDRAIKNLIQLGAILVDNGVFRLTDTGRNIIKLGIEPQLGKLIFDCCHFRLRREGVVLAAVMANASSIFCRVGNEEDKLKSDCFKVKFCHHNGDLFTLLSVYQEWETVPPEKKNHWCWTNSINAKSMRRCKDIVQELECCLKNDFDIIVPGYWYWKPGEESEHDQNLKKVILSSLAENVAMYSGHDRLGYQVALSGKHVQLHPSCSLLVYGQKPNWVVFGELISMSHQYLVCVTAFDYESLSTVFPPLPFDISQMERGKLQMALITGSGNTVLRRFCGKASSSLLCLESRLRTTLKDDRINIEVTVEGGEVRIFASSEHIEMVCGAVKEALDLEKRWLSNECIDKLLCRGGPSAPPSVALFGAGAEIKHLELGNRYLAVEVIYANASVVDDKELLMMFEERLCGISGFHKYGGNNWQDREDSDRWGRITFLAPESAEKAVAELNGAEFGGSLLKVLPSHTKMGSDHRTIPDSGIKARISWPRKYSKGVAFIRCALEDAQSIIDDCANLVIGRNHVVCEISKKYQDSVAISKLDKEVSESEIFEILRNVTSKTILDVHLVRGDAVPDLSWAACEEALLREIAPFMPSRIPLTSCCRVQVFPPEPKDYSVRALITFYGGLYLEAAKALDNIRGKVLPGCFSWQKIQCHQKFDSSVSCPAAVYSFIGKHLDSLFESFSGRDDVYYDTERNENGYYRVKISANATRTLVECRRPLEELMKGKIINHASLTPRTLQLLCSLDGVGLMRSIQRETGTYILHDKQRMNVRVFGPEDKVSKAERMLVGSLASLHEQRQPEIRLRGSHLPYDLMREVVLKFGPDLHGLKEKVPGAEITLNIRRHVVSVQGSEDMKKTVEEMIYDIARPLAGNLLSGSEGEESACPICLCELEESYQLEACSHRFCRSCLVEQIESAIKNQDSIPICCAHKDCKNPILLTDLRSLVSSGKLDELFRASVGAFVASSGGIYKFCPSPDCPSVYRVANAEETNSAPFLCGACYVETCRKCHLEYHACLTCEAYKVFKEDPDSSLLQWRKGKENVKTCPKCGYTIEKVEGCNHVGCRCGGHICWECLESFKSSDDCYNHLRDVHKSIV